MRPATDPRVRVVMGTIERSIASASRDRMMVSDSMAALTFLEDARRFTGWSDDAVRAVLLAFALNCPESELDRMAAVASRELQLIQGMEREHAAERVRVGAA